MKHVVLDLETNGLLDSVSRIHSLVLRDVETGAIQSEVKETLPRGLGTLACAQTIVGHNVIGFDLPVIQKLHGMSFNAKVRDTLLMAQLRWPEIIAQDYANRYFIPKELFGSHSLEAYGYRLGLHKGNFKGPWDQWSQEMQDYCIQDTAVTLKLYKELQKSIQEGIIPESAIEMEHEFAKLMQWQEELGVPFDTEAAIKLRDPLKRRIEEVRDELIRIVPPTIIKLKTKTKTVPFNPGSRDQILKFLQDKYDWMPEKRTKGGNASLDEEVLSGLTYPEAPLFVEYFNLQKLLGMLSEGKESWLNHVKNGRIHGRVTTAGAITGRCTHQHPNLGQIPSVRSFMGKEVRSLFYAPDGYSLVGIDASGLELRCLAHYLDHWDYGQYTQVVCEGDVHTTNMLAAGLQTRDQAKTFIYACVPMDTQILTRKGWKLYHEVREGDVVLTYNQKENLKEWKPILEKVYYEDADVMEMSHSHSFNVRTTPNHRWFVKQRRMSAGGKSYSRINGRYLDDQVKTTEEINTESNIVVNAPMKPDRESSFVFVENKYETDWCLEVLKMNSDERKAFLQGFLLADGSRNNTGQWVWNQNKTKIAEGLLLASFLESSGQVYARDYVNKANNRMMIAVNISKKGWVTGQKLKKRLLNRQPVWCIRTENESFVMRQGNCITITGNTLYGAGDEKIGSIVLPDGTKERKKDAGLVLRTRFMQQLPAYGALVKKINEQVDTKGYLVGIDGRRLTIRHRHAALNTLLQNAGAVACKTAWVTLFRKLKEQGIKAYPALNVHDEAQILVPTEHASEVGRLGVASIEEAGIKLGFKCPLTGAYRIGRNWSETH